MILLIGALTGDRNGQSLAFRFLVESEIENSYIFDNFRHRNKLLNTFFNLGHLTFFILRNKKTISTIYLSGSRSILGIIKDLPVFIFQKICGYTIINHLHGYEIVSISKRKTISDFLLYTFLKPKKNRILILLDKSLESCFTNSELDYVHIIKNFYSPDFERQVVYNQKQNSIIYFSNLMFSKGILDFLQVSKELLSTNQDYNIVIAGGFLGDDFYSKKEIENQFFSFYNDLKIEFPDRINYLGIVTGLKRVQLLLTSKIFVLPSFYKTEAIPLSIIEAMRMGNCIISTKHNLIPQLVSKKNGILIEPRSKNELLEALLSLTSNEKKLREISSYNVKYAQIKYSPLEHLNQLRIMFNSDEIKAC